MLLDTSGLLCYLNEQEPKHRQAAHILDNANSRLLTHGQVLSELIALATVRRFSRAATLAYVVDLVANPDIEVIWVHESLHSKAMQLLSVRRDKTYSLCDAISFVLMKESGLTEALTTDRHFEQEGFLKLL